MALTSEQEEKVLQMLNAFENGKRLSDLPNVEGTNPFDLTTEVLENGESKKAKLATLLPNYEDNYAYGVEIDTTVSAPAVTRVGNMAYHKSLPVQNRMRGCLLDDNGKVVEYLNPKDWTSHTRDGSRGQVMVEIPLHYARFITNGTKIRAMISEYPLPGYHKVPEMYVSAYEASLERSTGKLCSVVNDGTDYRGGNNTADWDGTYRSLLGRPVTSISRTAFRTAARKRKSGSTAWNCYVYMVHQAIYWLYTIEYANRNSQAAYNAELTAEGYKQGGLGDGVSGISDWSGYNGNNPFVPCGTTDTLGNQSGVVSYTALTSDGGTKYTCNVPRYRGIENPFGHVWKWTDGINIQINPTAENGGNDLSKVYTCNDPSKFNDTNYDGYAYIGNEARAEGYVTTLIFGETGCMLPSAVGGSSSTYYCDYHYTNIPTTVTLRGLLLGGFAASGAGDGLSCAGSSFVPSYTNANFGSRLCFIA